MNPSHSPPLGAHNSRSVVSQSRGFVALVCDLVGHLRDRFAPLWRDDPAVSAVLTEEFVDEFKSEFKRMVRDRIEAAGRGSGAAVMARLQATRCDTIDSLFDELLQRRSVIDRLDHRQRAVVVSRLMEHCQVTGSGLF